MKTFFMSICGYSCRPLRPSCFLLSVFLRLKQTDKQGSRPVRSLARSLWASVTIHRPILKHHIHRHLLMFPLYCLFICQTLRWQIEINSFSGHDDEIDDGHLFCHHAQNNASKPFHRRSVSCSLSPRTSLFAPREVCLLRQSSAAVEATMRFRSLLSKSAFPIRLNALWRRDLLLDTTLRVDKFH